MSEDIEIMLQICPESLYYLKVLELWKRLSLSLFYSSFYNICFTWVFTSLFPVLPLAKVLFEKLHSPCHCFSFCKTATELPSLSLKLPAL